MPRPGGGITAQHYSPTAEGAFKHEHWVKNLLSEAFLEHERSQEIPPRYGHNPVSLWDAEQVLEPVDFDTGLVDLSKVREVVSAADKILEAQQTVLGIGFKVPFGAAAQKRHNFRWVRSVLSSLENFDGMPIVLPNEHFEAVRKLVPGTDAFQESSLDRRPPSERILALHSEQPQLTKPEVKAKLFPSASERRFNLFWAQAAEKEPGLSKPGRRRS